MPRYTLARTGRVLEPNVEAYTASGGRILGDPVEHLVRYDDRDFTGRELALSGAVLQSHRKRVILQYRDGFPVEGWQFMDEYGDVYKIVSLSEIVDNVREGLRWEAECQLAK